MKTAYDMKPVAAIPAIATTATTATYNGAAVGSAVGVDVSGAEGVALVITAGAIGASHTTTLQVYASAASSNPSDLELVTGATTTVGTAEADGVKIGVIETSKLPEGKKYLYVKRTPGDTTSCLLGAALIKCDHKVLPAGATLAFDVK